MSRGNMSVRTHVKVCSQNSFNQTLVSLNQHHLSTRPFIAWRRLFCLVMLAMLPTAQPAGAHPQVCVTMRGEVVYGTGGTVTALRQAWSFDETYSAFAVEGID